MYANMNKFLEESRRARITAKSGIVTGSSKGFGALVERTLPRPIRELPKNIVGIFDSVAWNTISGATKQLISEALAQGNWKRAEFLLKGSKATIPIRSIDTANEVRP